MNSSIADAFQELLSRNRGTVSGGLPRYTYDPATQQYTSIGPQTEPYAKPSNAWEAMSRFGDVFSRALSKNKSSSDVPRYNYDPATQQYTLLNPQPVQLVQPANTGVMLNYDNGGGGGDGSGDGGGDGGGGDGGGSGERAGGIIYAKHKSYAPGGPVMNSGLAAAAQQVQDRGRGQDTMLVHMTPNEVKGLQALAMSHGGSLTINPQTGLPEAGFLSAILPTVLGAGLSMIPGVGPLMAAGIVGGLTGIATGSLGKGLLAGLGAYGGAGLTSGLAGAATAGTPEALASIESATPAMAEAEAAKQAALSSGASETAAQNAFSQTYVDKVTPFTGPSTGLGALASGTEGLLTPEGRSAFMAATPKGTLPTLAMTASSLFTPKPPKAPKKGQAYIRPYDVQIANTSRDFTPYTYADTSERPMVTYTYTPQPIYKAAEGGVIDPDYNMQTGGVAAFSDSFAAGGSTSLDALAKKRKSLKGDPYYKFAQDRRDTSMEASLEQNFASGGLKAALPPRFLSGGGDGMSDSIKANIDGKQEARLADGEFVVPADVVSHLGNGSSKAGAKKLYAMMDKIRKARTGKTSQAPQVNAAKYMPA